jgi:hypothetical protein
MIINQYESEIGGSVVVIHWSFYSLCFDAGIDNHKLTCIWRDHSVQPY